MEYRRMGRSGLKISELCLGAMTFGHLTAEEEAQPMVDLALDAGVNFFDTANSYAEGRSEIILGKALKGKRRQDVVLATKFSNPVGTGPNDSGMSRVHIINAIEGSLTRLQTDYVDLYYVHHVDEETTLEEMLRALDDLVHQGKVRYIGCSNYQVWRLCEALWTSDTKNLARFECYQAQYSMVVRDIEQELIPLCKLKELGVVAFSPLGSGFLSGKYKPGERIVPGTRSEEGWVFQKDYFAANADETLAALLDVAKDLGRSPAQVALRWVLDQPAVTSVSIGARTVEQFRDNLKAGEWHLERGSIKRLGEVSRLPDRYPESFEKGFKARRESAVKMPSLRY